MQFEKISSSRKSNSVLKTLIKIVAVLLLFFLVIILIDRIDFPSPNKKIEKIIDNETFKVVK